MQNEIHRPLESIGCVLQKLELHRKSRIAKIDPEGSLDNPILVINCNGQDDQYPPSRAVNSLVRAIFDSSVRAKNLEFRVGSCVINLGSQGSEDFNQQWLPSTINGLMLGNKISINYDKRVFEGEALTIGAYLSEDIGKVQTLELGELTPRIAWHLGVLIAGEDDSNVKLENRMD